MDADERQELLAEGLDPDDPTVIVAIDLARWELSLILGAVLEGWQDATCDDAEEFAPAALVGHHRNSTRDG